MARIIYHASKGFDSAAKEGVRAATYAGLGRDKLFGRYHIVIASRKCGDIKFLLSVGVKRSRIIACDVDPVARRQAGKLGVILSPHTSIGMTVAWAFEKYGKKAIGSINVDLCMALPVGIPYLMDIFDFGVHPSTAVFFTYFRGRDGMFSDNARLTYLRRHTGREPRSLTLYQSFTKDRQGSAMAIAELRT